MKLDLRHERSAHHLRGKLGEGLKRVEEHRDEHHTTYERAGAESQLACSVLATGSNGRKVGSHAGLTSSKSAASGLGESEVHCAGDDRDGDACKPSGVDRERVLTPEWEGAGTDRATRCAGRG